LAVGGSARAASLIDRFPRSRGTSSYLDPSCSPISLIRPVAAHYLQLIPPYAMLSVASPSSFLPPPLLLMELAELPPRAAFQHAGEGSHTRCQHYAAAAGISLRALTVTPPLYDAGNSLGCCALLTVSHFLYTLILLLAFVLDYTY
jgi:hypothetical protein